MEGREVSTIDITGAFMHADMKYEVNIKLEGTMTDIFYKIDPQLYEECFTMKNGKAVLYFRPKNTYMEQFRLIYYSIRS